MHLKYDCTKSTQDWRQHEFRTSQELNQAPKAACQDRSVPRCCCPAALCSSSLFPPHLVKRSCLSWPPGIPSAGTGILPARRKDYLGSKTLKAAEPAAESLRLHTVSQYPDHLVATFSYPKMEKSNLRSEEQMVQQNGIRTRSVLLLPRLQR